MIQLQLHVGPLEERTPCSQCGDRIYRYGVIRGAQYCSKCLPGKLEKINQAREKAQETQKAQEEAVKAVREFSRSLRKEGLSDEERRARVREYKRTKPRPKTAPLLADQDCCKKCRTKEGPFVKYHGRSTSVYRARTGKCDGTASIRGYFLCHPCFHELMK